MQNSYSTTPKVFLYMYCFMVLEIYDADKAHWENQTTLRSFEHKKSSIKELYYF